MKTVRRRRAFTLVELLVVVTIIGILAAILIPTVNIVRKRVKNARTALEINQIQSALEAYKAKYGDYPPDFSDPAVVLRHVSKAFPRISGNAQDPNSEINVLSRFATLIDPAEAVVFWLGGLSSDPKRPFTGEGGPLKALLDTSGSVVQVNGVIQYGANSDRNSPLFAFAEARLTYGEPDANGNLLSTDEQTLYGLANDPFPIYIPSGLKMPYVYFDSRSYQLAQYLVEADQNAGTVHAARPYRTDTRDPAVLPGALNLNDPLQAQRLWKWASDKTFQIVSAGLDDFYGLYPSDNVNPLQDNFLRLRNKLFQVRSEHPAEFQGNNYTMSDLGSDLDNICSFSDGRTLEDCMP